MTEHRQDLTTSQPGSTYRFGFGENWTQFLALLTEERVLSAVQSLASMLGTSSLTGQSFLDIGSGSGLFSLAARRLDAGRVHSFDYDAHSVNCTAELKRRFFPNDARWTVEQGSALDQAYLETLGQFDTVYSWGVLHHTGAMWDGIANACARVRPGGRLFLAIYNEQNGSSRRWRAVKRTYNRLPRPLGTGLVAVIAGYWEIRAATIRGLRGGNPIPFWDWSTSQSRGMNRWHDWIDWVGGYPFEVARPEEVFSFCHQRGFSLDALRTNGGWGCNEFVLTRALRA